MPPPYRKPRRQEEGTGSPVLDVGPPAPVTDTLTPPPEPPLDWLGVPGLPTDVQAKIDAIFRDGAPNPVERAMAYLRSTPWYAQTYRGIGQGIAKGVISSEADYRGYVNQVNQAYRQYWGRDATGDEIETFLTAGYAPGVIGQIGAGRAYAQANRADIQYLAGAFTDEGQLDESELQTYGEQVVGRDSALGASLRQKLDAAVRKVERVFQVNLATSPIAIDSL
jgi:hypothetical protein